MANLAISIADAADILSSSVLISGASLTGVRYPSNDDVEKLKIGFLEDVEKEMR